MGEAIAIGVSIWLYAAGAVLTYSISAWIGKQKDSSKGISMMIALIWPVLATIAAIEAAIGKEVVK